MGFVADEGAAEWGVLIEVGDGGGKGEVLGDLAGWAFVFWWVCVAEAACGVGWCWHGLVLRWRVVGGRVLRFGSALGGLGVGILGCGGVALLGLLWQNDHIAGWRVEMVHALFFRIFRIALRPRIPPL